MSVPSGRPAVATLVQMGVADNGEEVEGKRVLAEPRARLTILPSDLADVFVLEHVRHRMLCTVAERCARSRSDLHRPPLSHWARFALGASLRDDEAVALAAPARCRPEKKAAVLTWGERWLLPGTELQGQP
jgi:hypothetical protein